MLWIFCVAKNCASQISWRDDAETMAAFRVDVRVTQMEMLTHMLIVDVGFRFFLHICLVFRLFVFGIGILDLRFCIWVVWDLGFAL